MYINTNHRKDPLVSTYSIMAIDRRTGDIGIAAQSHWFAVGTVLPWLKPGVGAIAVQSFVNLQYATYGLAMMEDGELPRDVIKSLLKKDITPEIRQITMLDTKGHIETYTGNRCVEYAGHIIGDNYSVQGNMMTEEETLDKMADAFENTRGNLATKMLASIKVADEDDGDLRGRQSACMKIVSNEMPKHLWDGIMLDVRVDDNKDPVSELERLITIHTAYQHMNRAEMAFGSGEMETAFKEYATAQKLYPDNPEISFWEAVSLANIGKYHEAFGIFYIIFEKDPSWKALTRRLISAEILNIDIDFIEKLFPNEPEIVDEILEENFKKYSGQDDLEDI